MGKGGGGGLWFDTYVGRMCHDSFKCHKRFVDVSHLDVCGTICLSAMCLFRSFIVPFVVSVWLLESMPSTGQV